VHRQRSAIGERLDSGCEPAAGQQRRVDAVSEFAQLLDRRARVFERVADEPLMLRL
jgi:hypothetical protein